MNMHTDEERETLSFKPRGPVPIFCEDERPADLKSGCSILDLSFAEPVMIGEIRFRNYYTAYLSLSCKRVPSEKDVKNRDILPWQISIRHLLMQDPHCEQNSQDIVSITAKESSVSWTGVVNLRFVLKQPSFKWLKFGIKDLTIFKGSVKDGKPVITTHTGLGSFQKTEQKLVLVDQCEKPLKPRVQNLMAVAELMRDKQASGAAVGRFEVDGSYDISHLI